MSRLRSKSSPWAIGIGLVLLVFGVLVFWQRVYVLDWLTIQQYPPSSQVSAMAERVSLSEYGKMVFYASRPELTDADRFNESCGSHNSETALIGCFANSQIYLYQIKDKELDGIVEVTAAHEMLHAAYSRLDSGEKEQLDQLLMKQADVLSRDQKFQKRMSAYQRLTDAEQLNEYHSIFGTEIGQLIPDLAKYYTKYFSNRQEVIDLHERYSSVFDELQAKSERLVAELEIQAAKINTATKEYQQLGDVYRQMVASFNSRAKSGKMTREQFTVERQALETRRLDLIDKADQINSRIKDYNDKQKELEGISIHMTKLNTSINSNIAPPPSEVSE